MNKARSGIVWCFLALGVVTPSSLPGQISIPDSSRIDSAAVQLKERSHFIRSIGRMAPPTDTVPSFHHTNVVRTDAMHIGDVLRQSPETFLRDLGEPGQYSQLMLNGMDLRAVSLTLDGRVMNDPLTGTYNLFDLPLEYLEQVQLMTSPLAPTLSIRSAGGLINAVSHQYSALRPVTKIRFLQGPYQHILTDGLYTQDVARDVNFMLGFQRHVTDGRYLNAEYDSWNLRTRFRFNFSDQLNVAISDFYTKRSLGMNGGVFIDSTRSIYNATSATVRSADASETLSRHDLTLKTVGRFFQDSTDLTLLDIFYTSYDREFRDGAIFGSAKPDFHSSETFGFRADQRLHTGALRWNLGAQALRTNVLQSRQLSGQSETITGLWASVSLHSLSFVEPRVMFRNEQTGSKGGMSYGIEVRIPVADDRLTITGGFSTSKRLPTLQERSWNDSTFVRSQTIEPESHRLMQLGIQALLPLDVRLRLTGYTRTIEDAILFKPLPSTTRFPAVLVDQSSDVSYTGLTVDAVLPVWRLELHAALSYLEYSEGDTVKLLSPKYRAFLELTYRDMLLDGNLLVTLGVRSLAVSTHRGMEFVPQMLLFVDHQGNDVGRFATLDIFGTFKIGDAYVLLAWENILNNGYYVTPIHPLPDSNLKLGVNWVFLD